MTEASGRSRPPGKAAIRFLRHLLAACCAALLGGCAVVSSMFETAPAPSDVSVQADESAETPRALPVRVRIEAPRPLRELVEKNLDLTRLPALSTGEPIGESEWTRLVDSSPAQVRELLQTEGYFAPTVTVQRGSQPAAATAPREVTIVVVPGPRTTVSRATIEVQGSLQEQASSGDARARALVAELQRAWPMQPGAVFRNTAWADAKTQLLARLRANGYAAASWSGTAAEIDRDANQVRLFVVADSGPLFRAGEIHVDGLKLQDAQTVLNLAEFGAGAPLTESLLLDYQERLQKSGLFENVTVTHDLDPDHASSADVQVQLSEQTPQVYTFGVGYSANTGPRASIEHVNRRLFGYPLRSRAYLQVGGQKQTLDLELSTNPGPRRDRLVGGVIVERLKSSDDVVTSQRVRLGQAFDGQRFEQLYFVEAERGLRTTNATDTAPATHNQTLALSLNAHFVLRDLDSVVLPTRGYTLALQGGVGRSRASGDSDAIGGSFVRAYERFTGYVPLGDTWYSQGRLELGHVFRGDRVAAPDSQLWRAGGDDSVRGYGYRDLGPIVDGAVTSGGTLLTTSVEVARPFSARIPSLWGAAFIDAGSAADSFRDLKPVVGTGVGLRWRSPVGPLRLDLAYGVDVHRWRLHFSIGIAL